MATSPAQTASRSAVPSRTASSTCSGGSRPAARSRPGTRETWNSIVYYKPTTLASHLDPAVTSRVGDYRGPDAPGILAGTSWQDPDENTASDNFNEAEAAYLFNLDQTNGLRFTMNGSVTNRIQPFFKIRRWRSFNPPATIVFDPDSGGATPSVTLSRDVHYRADVKPVSRAHFASRVLFHSTLESFAAVTTPDVGDGTGATENTMSYGLARYGAGAVFDSINDYVRVPLVVPSATQSVEFDRGRIELLVSTRTASTPTTRSTTCSTWTTTACSAGRGSGSRRSPT